MVQAICTKLISDTVTDAIYAAGFSSLSGLADPKAMAVATFASKAAARCFNAALSPLNMSEEQRKQSPLANTARTTLSIAATIVVAYYAGKFAGQYINPSFNFFDASRTYGKYHLAGGCLFIASSLIEASLRKPVAPKIENSETDAKKAPVENQDSATVTTIKALCVILPLVAAAALMYRNHQQSHASLKSFFYDWNLLILKAEAEMAARNATSIFANNTCPLTA